VQPDGGGLVSQSAGETLTGDPAVDEALRTLEDLPGRPLRDHVSAFEAVHGALSDRLAEGRG
jgi:hypothetical protein